MFNKILEKTKNSQKYEKKNDVFLFIENRKGLMCENFKINGNTIKNTAKILDIDRRTGSEWLRKYNENGVEGLIPHFNKRGRKCLLSDEQLKQLELEVVEKRNIRSIKDAQKYIYSNFHINYSYKQAWEIMRVKLGFNYGKPFLKYKERPENYKEEFKKK